MMLADRKTANCIFSCVTVPLLVIPNVSAMQDQSACFFSYFVGRNLGAVREILEIENGICLQTERSGWQSGGVGVSGEWRGFS